MSLKLVLPLKTLQGYLGEVFGGLIAITQRPFDLDWEIPVHLFSFHDTVFDWLDMYLQNAEISTDIPGRTGDDNLAFLRNKNNEIIFKAQNIGKNQIVKINNKIKNTSVLELPCNTSKKLKIGEKLTFISE